MDAFQIDDLPSVSHIQLSGELAQIFLFLHNVRMTLTTLVLKPHEGFEDVEMPFLPNLSYLECPSRTLRGILFELPALFEIKITGFSPLFNIPPFLDRLSYAQDLHQALSASFGAKRLPCVSEVILDKFDTFDFVTHDWFHAEHYIYGLWGKAFCVDEVSFLDCKSRRILPDGFHIGMTFIEDQNMPPEPMYYHADHATLA